VTKRTPRERLQALREGQLAAMQAEIENCFADAEARVGAMSDPNLSVDQRLKIFKNLRAWPRIVLGIYRAELAIAQKVRKENRAPEYGLERPCEIARHKVGKAVGLKPDRICDLCKEGRQHEKQGMPQEGDVAACDFKREVLSTVLPDSLGAAYRELFSIQKEQWLSYLMERVSVGRPLI
jgi:hypothetical protein